MRRLRTLFLVLPLALAAGTAMASPDIHQVGGYGYGYGGGYGYGRPHYAPPPPPRHWGPAPVFRPYYAPPPRPYWGGPHWRPHPHWRHRHGW